MININDLEQLVVFSETETLSIVAEKFHISQPSVTRSMQRLESEFGVPLFNRSKNHIELNENGKLAAEQAKLVLNQTHQMLSRVREYDRLQRTISIGSCEAYCVLDMVSKIRNCFPDMTISSEIKPTEPLLGGLEKDLYQLIILPFIPDDDTLYSKKIGEEELMFLLYENHRFAGRKTLSFEDMNGENILLYYEIGFWRELVDRKMPDSKFLVQNERYTFQELITNSVLSCFTSDVVLKRSGIPHNRVAVPISDREARAEYFLVTKKKNKEKFSQLFK